MAEEIKPYAARLLMAGWQSKLSDWMHVMGVPHSVEAVPPELEAFRVPWDGDQLYLDPLHELGPAGWFHAMMHVGNAARLSRREEPGLAFEMLAPASQAVVEGQMRVATMAMCVEAGATADWLWKTALAWKLTRASLYINPEEVMGRHLDQVRGKIDTWQKRHRDWGLPDPPTLWPMQLVTA